MKLTLAVKLAPDEAQHASLLQTMERFNAACDWIAGVAYREGTANKIRLQHLVYGEIRDRFGLSAQHTVRAISKVCEAFKRDKSIQPRFRPHGAVPYDERIMSWKDADRVSLLTLSGRQIIPYRFGEYQAARRDRIRGQADLVLRWGVFYLYCTVDAPPAPEGRIGDYLGVDLGIVNLAVDSDGRSFSGKAVDSNRRILAHRRRNLQRKGTKAARRKLKRLGHRQRRYQTDVNHVISKHVVAKAKDTERGLVLEDLLGIRERGTVRRRQRARHANWGFRQLRTYIEYKARQAGVPVVLVDPHHTSRTCPECGCVDRQNRRSQASFLCVSCGFAAPADHVAARIIRARALVMEPNGLRAKVSDIDSLSVVPGTSLRGS